VLLFQPVVVNRYCRW